jgi:hypothetical protein
VTPNPYAGKFIWDSWGRRARSDWEYSDDAMATGTRWRISGEGGPTSGYQLFDSEAAAWDWARANPNLSGLGNSGPSDSQNAYNAALRAQGIDPSELPYDQVGQEATARVLQQHGLQIPAYLQPFLGKPAGGGNSAQPGTVDIYSSDNAMRALGPAGGFLPIHGGGGQADPFQNTIAARFLARSQEQQSQKQAQMLREFIKRVMLAGQQQKQPVSPGMISAAMGRVVSA